MMAFLSLQELLLSVQLSDDIYHRSAHGRKMSFAIHSERDLLGAVFYSEADLRKPDVLSAPCCPC